MSLVKSLYEDATVDSPTVFNEQHTTPAQKCMFCRENMDDFQMGQDWSKKLRNVQYIMIYQMYKRLYGDGLAETMKEVCDRCNEGDDPKTFSYITIEQMVEQKKDLKKICKFLKAVQNLDDFSIPAQNVAYWDCFRDEENIKDAIEVEVKTIKGKEYYYAIKEKKYYDMETEEEVVF